MAASSNCTSKRVLLVYPEFFPTYWGMQYFLPLMGLKALMPPLGLITIAAACPADWEFRLVDLNCEALSEDDIAWADLILMSAMLPQKDTLFRAATRCRRPGKLLIVGGPYPTACPEECRPHFDVVVMNEGEVTWPLFLADYAQGTWKPVYTSEEKPDITASPCPRFDLLRLGHYAIIPLQFSRGCPYLCEFCDIIVMYGRRPRTKTPSQFVAELQALYDTGYRGAVFVVDDNFIGNRKSVAALLPELEAWNVLHGRPFYFGTEATVNLAEHPGLMRDMYRAGFNWVFLGIETPSVESLKETRKSQNVSELSLLDRVKAIQANGLCVYGGFIIGFDSDRSDIFDRQIAFITEAAIPSAMIGPLVALPGTPLYKRLQAEGRLLETGSNREHTIASGYTNFVTRIPKRTLLEGHIRILQAIYQPAAFFARTLETFRRIPRPPGLRAKLEFFFLLSRLGFGVRTKTDAIPVIGALRYIVRTTRAFARFPPAYQRQCRRFLVQVLRHTPESLPVAFYFVMAGYHYYRFTFEDVVPDLQRLLAEEPAPSGASETLDAAA